MLPRIYNICVETYCVKLKCLHTCIMTLKLEFAKLLWTLANFLSFSFNRNFVSDIHAKTGQILNRGSAQQIGGSVGGGYDNTVAIKVHIW